jgi:hypothetical protein
VVSHRLSLIPCCSSTAASRHRGSPHCSCLCPQPTGQLLLCSSPTACRPP